MGLNNVVLCGNLGRDAELRKVAATVVCTFQIAVTETWKKDGARQERTDWFLCEIWGKHGEALADYLTKGKQVVVRGKLRTDSYEGKTGQKVHVVKVRVEEVVFTGSPRDKGQRPADRTDDGTDAWE